MQNICNSMCFFLFLSVCGVFETKQIGASFFLSFYICIAIIKMGELNHLLYFCACSKPVLGFTMPYVMCITRKKCYLKRKCNLIKIIFQMHYIRFTSDTTWSKNFVNGNFHSLSGFSFTACNWTCRQNIVREVFIG